MTLRILGITIVDMCIDTDRTEPDPGTVDLEGRSIGFEWQPGTLPSVDDE